MLIISDSCGLFFTSLLGIGKVEIEIPVCPFNYLLTLKAIPNRLKDDFDFCLLLLNKNYSADEFVHYLKECADTKPFLNKCKRISNREYFFSLPKSVITNYTFDLVKFKAVFKRIEEVKSLSKYVLNHIITKNITI